MVMFTWLTGSPLSWISVASPNCQLELGEVHRVNRIDVISGLRVLFKCLLKILWKGNLLKICLVGFLDIRPWNNWVMRCCPCYLSGARCKLICVCSSWCPGKRPLNMCMSAVISSLWRHCCALLLQHVCIINANGQEKYRIPASSTNSHAHLCRSSNDAH